MLFSIMTPQNEYLSVAGTVDAMTAAARSIEQVLIEVASRGQIVAVAS